MACRDETLKHVKLPANFNRVADDAPKWWAERPKLDPDTERQATKDQWRALQSVDDAIGRYRATEKDRPVDASGHFVTRSGDKAAFKNVLDLARFVAASDEAHEALVARLFHAAELQSMPNVIPQDLAVVLMHARRDILFRAKQAAPPADSMPSGE